MNGETQRGPAETGPEARQKIEHNEPALRTLEGDIAEAVQRRNASLASMAIASEEAHAKERGDAEQASSGSGGATKALLVVASVILVILGVGGGYYLYLRSPLAPSAPAAPGQAQLPSLFAVDSQKTLDITGLGQQALLAKVASALAADTGRADSVNQIIPIVKDSAGGSSIADVTDFLVNIGMSPPDILTRSLSGTWMIGTYTDVTGKAAPFLILSNDFFQNAYAGMIAWEKTLPDNFSGLFGYSGQSASSTAGSLPASYFSIQGSFKGATIMNKDVRAFIAPDGTTLLLYSFTDNNTVVITSESEALAAIIARFEKQTFIR